MGTAETGSRAVSRGVGWGILGAVAFTWVVIVVWITIDPCGVPCQFLGTYGRSRLGLVAWFISLAAVPVAAWLLASAYAPDGERRAESFAATVGMRVLYLFSVAMLWIALNAAFQLLVSVGDIAFRNEDLAHGYFSVRDARPSAASSIVIGAWCGLIGFVTFVAARRLDEALAPPASASAAWQAAGAIALAAVVGAAAGWNVIDRERGIFDSVYGDRDDVGYIEDPETYAPPPTPVTPPPASPAPSPVSPAPPARPVLGYLPVVVNHERSGWRIYDPRIQVKRSKTAGLGNSYKITYSGVWTQQGRFKSQKCTYTFLDRNNISVLTHDVGHTFVESGRVFTRSHAVTFFDSHMDGKPARAKIACRDEA
jgi:hypothetical protein